MQHQKGYSLLETILALALLTPVLGIGLLFINKTQIQVQKNIMQDKVLEIPSMLRYHILHNEISLTEILNQTTFLYAGYSIKNGDFALVKNLNSLKQMDTYWAICPHLIKNENLEYLNFTIHPVYPPSFSINTQAIYSFPLCPNEQKDLP